ncbi:Avirulence protein (Avh) [Phytophthora palmivora]|uniref:Avirulence protein (Avh) n=1 Tax=Phytophthora palmivora TaxID=4796 RepID=A0A2P4YEU0_9STRA|nr:Avirulence protein (Avh) [Phytophthora palmivora]
MELFRFAVLVALLVCVESTSTMTAPAVLFSEAQSGHVQTRSLRTENDDENRMNFNVITDAVKSTRFELWLIRKKSGVAVLNKLQLGNNIDDALKNTQLNTLWKYVEMFNNKYPTTKISVIDSLRIHYTDDVVMKALVNAKQVDDTKVVATKLETELFEGWMKNTESVDDVFTILKLHEQGSQLFRSEKLDILENYIAFINGKKHKKESLADVLTKGFGEKQLLSILGVAKGEALTAKKATELETKVLLAKAEGQMKALQKLYLADDGLESVIRSKYLDKLEKYINTLSTRYDNKDVSLIRTLMTKYGDRAVAKALVDAKSVKGTQAIATKLQTQQFEAWAKDGKSVDDVFELLQLKRLQENVVNSRALETLEGYINVFNRKNSAHESFMGTLSKGFGGDSDLAIMLETAKVSSITDKKATELQTKLFQHWFDEGVDWKKLIYDRFKVPPLDMATREQIRIAQDYRAFFNSKNSV